MSRVRLSETNYVSFDKHLCTACWTCVRVCPRHVFKKINLPFHKHARLRRADDCNGCVGLPHLRCARVCKSSAIRLKQLSTKSAGVVVPPA